jgi:hypothetical protein
MQTNMKLIEAIHEVQQEIDILKREATADAGKFSYKYTAFPTMWLELKPLLKKHGLTVLQSPVGSDGSQMGDFLLTEIHHSSGEARQWFTRLIITRDDPQGYGSAITYAERYIIKTIFKIVTDDDNDATTQRLADGTMKREWVQAYTVVAKKQDPDHTVTNQEFMNFMTEVYGKHPSKILAKEHDNVLGIINAFDTKE